MDLDGKATKKELELTIERRLQFALLMALYLPTIWDKVILIFRGFYASSDYQLHLGVIITSLLAGYACLELLKKEYSLKSLRILGGLTLCASCMLVIIIGTTSLYNPADVILWKFIVVGLASILFGFSAYSILIISVWTMWKPILKPLVSLIRKK